MAEWIEGLLEQWGYLGIALLMLIENVFPPIPSELIMPLAGYAANRGDQNLALVIAAGTLGSLAGATFWYYVAHWIGAKRLRAFAGRHGRWITLSPADLDRVDRWFDRHCAWAVLLGRMVPGVRTLISVPAGLFGMSLRRFLVYSGIGTLAWTAALAGAGYALGAQHDVVGRWLGPASNFVFAIIVAVYLYRVATWKPH